MARLMYITASNIHVVLHADCYILVSYHEEYSNL